MISRQFLEMPRSRIEGLLASFPKLIPAGSQHTTIETADVRFVYQPMEDLYVILITNKQSNILQVRTEHTHTRARATRSRLAGGAMGGRDTELSAQRLAHQHVDVEPCWPLAPEAAPMEGSIRRRNADSSFRDLSLVCRTSLRCR